MLQTYVRSLTQETVEQLPGGQPRQAVAPAEVRARAGAQGWEPPAALRTKTCVVRQQGDAWSVGSWCRSASPRWLHLMPAALAAAHTVTSTASSPLPFALHSPTGSGHTLQAPEPVFGAVARAWAARRWNEVRRLLLSILVVVVRLLSANGAGT